MYAFEHADDERKLKESLTIKWASIQERVGAVIKDLASPEYSETPMDKPLEVLEVDIDYDLDDDTNGGARDWVNHVNDETEVIT